MYQSILPHFDEMYVVPETPPGFQAANGIGSIFALSPVLATLNGLGDAADQAAAVADPTGSPAHGVDILGPAAVATTVLLFAGLGFLAYSAGKAMAPAGSNKKTWGWVAVPVVLFTGFPGIGIMGVVANAKGR